MSRLIESGTTDGVGFGNADETDAPLNIAGEFNVAGTLNLDQALDISGVVLDDSQAPIQDATIGVTLTENGADVIYETTDVNGEYAFTEHPDGDSTKQEWHVTAAKNDAGDLFNAESKPFVRATLTPTIIQATGGDVVQDVTLNGVDYRTHAFTTVGSQSFEVTNVPAQNDTVDVLLVGGGGSGGGEGSNAGSGGGGAGGVRFFNVAVGEETIPIVVGAGGDAVFSRRAVGNDGDASSFGAFTVIGGGGGGAYEGKDGRPGGSGGGGGSGDGSGAGGGSTAFGNDGGQGGQDSSNPYEAGGGGGAGQPGEDASGNVAGDGGDGLDFSTEFGTSFGENGYFGGGGGGSHKTSETSAPLGVGGLGGGGNAGGDTNDPAEDGLVNTGGGGGGVSDDNVGPSGAGGSGIVIIRYEI